MTRKQELREYIKQGAPSKQKLHQKPKKYLPKVSKDQREKLAYKESYGGEGTIN